MCVTREGIQLVGKLFYCAICCIHDGWRVMNGMCTRIIADVFGMIMECFRSYLTAQCGVCCLNF
jgi:hypothetical protein